MKIREIFAINVKYYRQQLNLSQEKLAALVDTSLSYINRIEKAKIDIKSSTIDKFAEKLNISFQDLITYNKNHITNFTRIDEKK